MIKRSPLKSDSPGKCARWHVVVYNRETKRRDWHTVRGTLRDAQALERKFPIGDRPGARRWRSRPSSHLTSASGGRDAVITSGVELQRCYQIGSELPNFSAGRCHCNCILAIVVGDRSLRAIPKSVVSMRSDQSVASAAPRSPAIAVTAGLLPVFYAGSHSGFEDL